LIIALHYSQDSITQFLAKSSTFLVLYILYGVVRAEQKKEQPKAAL